MNLTALRVAAIVIGVVAVLDPSITANRPSRPVVSVMPADPLRDSVLSERVARELDRRFDVVRGALDVASATVVTGTTLPDDARQWRNTLYAVTPRTEASVRVIGLSAPAESPLNARIPVQATVLVTGQRGRQVTVALKAGSMVVDRKVVPIVTDTATVPVTLAYAPTTIGPALLRGTATVEGTSVGDSATIIVEARDERLNVLFFDPRASWMSTFVRRALESDPRFSVTHRMVTSRGVANTGGPAPVSLRDATALTRYSAVIVAAPEQLTDADVAGLDEFMRLRGGRVVLLMDRRAAGPVDRLTGMTDWRAVRLQTPASVGELRSQEIAWPAALSAGAATHAEHVSRDSTRRAVVWSVALGAGRVLVSGALDSWHYRDPSSSGFDAFWSNTIADLAAGAPRAIDITALHRVLAPGQETRIVVRLRDATMSNRPVRTAGVSALLIGANDSVPIRLWPDQVPGKFTGMIVAPRQSGAYRLVVSSAGERSELSIAVDPAARAPSADDRDLISAFVSSRGGSVVDEAQLTELPARLAAALPVVSRVETWHPMRSPWWILPFAILLGAEWWWRRRRGLA